MGGTAAERLGERLASFLTDLPADERALLAAILADEGSGAEVSGYDAGATWSALSGVGPPGAEPTASIAATLSNLAALRHEMLKTVVNNIRA